MSDPRDPRPFSRLLPSDSAAGGRVSLEDPRPFSRLLPSDSAAGGRVKFAQPLRGGVESALSIDEPRRRSHGTAVFLHALLLATALLVFAYPIALRTGLVAGALASIAGSLFAERLVARRYRLYAIGVLSILVVLAGALAVYVLTSATAPSEILGPVLALEAAEATRWGAVALGGSIALRATALRYRAALAIEGGVVVLAIATTVAAHRDGMIARPLEVSDWFWSQGIDPVLAFLAIGLFGGFLLAGVLVSGRSRLARRFGSSEPSNEHARSGVRTLFQLLFVFLLGLVLMVRIHGAEAESKKKNPSGAELDASKDNRSGSGSGGGGGQGDKGQSKDDPMPSNGQPHQNRPAAVVVFHKDVSPAAGVFYFRHAAFSQYNGVRLIEATRGDVDRDAVRAFPTMREDVPDTLKEAPGRTLVATDVALLSDHNRMFTLTDATEASPMPNPEPARFRRAYHVVSSVITEAYPNLLGAAAGDPSWNDEIWKHYTEIPKDERYRNLAKELEAELRPEFKGDPLAAAMVIKRYLEKTATYSFSRSYESEKDPTAEFLFSEDKKGYCVHLAHSAAYLLRALGVPARVSAGYAVPAANLGGGSALLIKSGDAHAWAEIYLEDIGWVPIEVTPEKTDIKPQPFQEKDLQQLFGEMARKEGRDKDQAYQGPRLIDVLSRAFKLLLRLMPPVLLGLLALAYSTKLYRLFIAPRIARDAKKPRVVYRAGLDRLSAVGLLRSKGEGRERFAKRVDPISPTFRSLTAVHVACALGSRSMRAGLAAGKKRFVALPSEVAREVRRGVPWWVWVLGALNPVSWFWSR
jgi:protein-glutamine gamma-glutamyltransferase